MYIGLGVPAAKNGFSIGSMLGLDITLDVVVP